jgi:hypothetical protein
MARMLRAAAPALVLAGALCAAPAFAAGPFDGTWVLDLPSYPFNSGQTNAPCPTLRLSAKIVNSQVTGSLERVPSGTADTIENGTGRISAPITGSVQADGMLVADWQGYHASGTLSGDSGRIIVLGQCGPRTAIATRVAK